MTVYRQDVTAERLRELLTYNPETGAFRHRIIRRGVTCGSVAGSDNGRGYLRISVDGIGYRAHRLAWLYVYGVWPADQLDHINGDQSDNRIVNLREASPDQNQQNRTISKYNKCGIPGVSWDKTAGKWRAAIKVKGKYKSLGRFDSLEAAAKARADGKAKYHTFQPTVRGAQP